MDMFKSGANNTPETLTAVGGGVKSSSNEGFSLFVEVELNIINMSLRDASEAWQSNAIYPLLRERVPKGRVRVLPVRVKTKVSSQDGEDRISAFSPAWKCEKFLVRFNPTNSGNEYHLIPTFSVQRRSEAFRVQFIAPICEEVSL